MFSNLGTGELLVIALVALLIFGPKQLPELMKNLGSAVRKFKSAVNAAEDEIKQSIDQEIDKDKKTPNP